MEKYPKKFNNSFLPDNELHRRLDLVIRGVASFIKMDLQVYGNAFLHPIDRIQGNLERFEGLEAQLFEDVSGIARECLDLKLEIHGAIEPCAEDETMLYIGNHPKFEEIWTWAEVLSKTAAPKSRAIGKMGMLFDPRMAPPLLGWAIVLGGYGGFINRWNHDSAISATRKTALEVMKPQTGLAFYPDSRRPFPERVVQEREYWKKKYPEHDLSWLKHTCFPRSGGLMTILQATEAIPNLRIINTTSAIDRPEIVGGTIHMHLEEVERGTLLPEYTVFDQKIALQSWLYSEWKRKNEMIEQWHLTAK